MDSGFVLLTAAKNEEKYIGLALESVVRQSVHPLAWYIVDDGSTDSTPHVVERYALAYPFIHLLHNQSGGERSFGAQYRAITMAYQTARKSGLDYDFVGMHDADIALQSTDYFKNLLAAFTADSSLGVAGGYIFEKNHGRWRSRPANSPQAVAGGLQMFRRRCFEDIGGYTPLRFGGEDWLAQIEAKRFGWHIRALTTLAAFHHRPTSSADGRLRGLVRLGMMDASFGSHPVFEILKCARRYREKPYVIASLIRFYGYVRGSMSMDTPLLPPETVDYLRREQKLRLTRLASPFRSAAKSTA
ncbi:glycosyltransferase family 2 protein [Parahaliea mediterranea]|uniref:Glycosyltransferase family 2 protein n=1 Tax=Parahaliea mediterranea TaxID=651086 RepID=A0A939DBY0_9GAMM|nr:glycosyltransferase family A protein [Parahaliea mediterranea]MBN7795244.1 glycosyltransferase family 2 protein [Parahaliea mediterranea]